EKIRILREEYEKTGDKEASDLLELKIRAFGQNKITKENAGKIVMDLERVLNGLPVPPIPPADDYCEVGLIESNKEGAIQNRWLTSALTTGAKKELSYSSSSPSIDGYVKAPKIEVQQGKSFSLNLVATTNYDDIRYTRATIYADWNRDKIFNTFGNEVVATYGEVNKGVPEMLNITAKFNVPANAVVGESRIRVRYADAWDPEPAPCGYNLKGFTFDIPMQITFPDGVEVNTVSGDADYIYHDGVFSFASPSEITIYSINGSIVCHEKDILSLQTNGYSHGSYIAKIVQGKKMSTTKISL
ncbi:MAG: GEVED domain-containing protein, partial [Bacteroidales bacterium]